MRTAICNEPCRMLKNDGTEAPETPGNPEPLGMPLQYPVSGIAVAATHKYPGQTLDVAFNPAGQAVGQLTKVERTATVSERWVEEYVEAATRLDELNAVALWARPAGQRCRTDTRATDSVPPAMSCSRTMPSPGA